MSKRGFKTSQTGTKQDAPYTTPAAPPPTPDQTPSWRLLKPAFFLFKRNAPTVAFVVLLPSLLMQLGTSLIAGFRVFDNWTLLGLFMQFCAGLLILANIAAPYVMQLRIVHDRRPGIWEVYRDSIRFIPRIAGFSLLFGFLLIGGLLLFVIPGLIVLRRYFLTPYFLIDKDIGIREAMQQSAITTKPIRRHMWALLGILAAFTALGFGLAKLSPVYGQFIAALPPLVYFLLPALRYREAVELVRR